MSHDPSTTQRHHGGEDGVLRVIRWVMQHGGDVLDREGDDVIVKSLWGPQRVRPGEWIVKERGTMAKYGPRMMAER